MSSLCKYSFTTINKNDSSPTPTLRKTLNPCNDLLPVKFLQTANFIKRISLLILPRTPVKASMTVETALVLPLFCFFMIHMESTLRFASRLNDTLIATGKTNIKGLYLLWNMVDGREKSELYKVYEQVIGELGLKVLNTFLPDSKRFRRELTGEHRALFRSTLFPADGTLVKGSNLKEITEELLSIIKK